MFCSQCGQENPDQAVACFKCGKPLGAGATSIGPSASGTAAAAYAPYQPAVSSTGSMPAVEPQTDGKATASLILGILSLTCFGVLTGVPAVILGHISRSNIRKSLGKLKGDGMALAGLITGYVSIAMLPIAIMIVAAIAIPNLLRARIAANESGAVASVRTIATASSTYQVDKAMYPATLEDLQKAGLIDSSLANGTKNGYRFTYTSTGDHFFVVAVPVNSGNTGTRNFCGGEDNIVRTTMGEECTAESPAL